MNRESKEQPSTYVVQDRKNKEELQRLITQDQIITHAMGGVLAEQPDPAAFHRVLDIGCGPGGWCCKVAKQYPEMEVFGIDISHRMIAHAREQTEGNDNVEFHVMDALLILEFPPDYFDVVNLRFGISFVRLWEWNKMILEMLRVTKRDGIVRVTETSVVHQSTSPALKHFQEVCLCAMQRAGYLSELNPSGITAQLASLLQRYGVHLIQTKIHRIEFHTGTEECIAYIEDITHAMQTLKPFIQKWGCALETYDTVCQVAREEMQHPDFQATWELLTAWGRK